MNNSETLSFVLPRGKEVLTDLVDIMNYKDYQKNYKQTYGVMPELDKINNPVTAIIAENIFLPEHAQKAERKNNGSVIAKTVGKAFKSGISLATGDIGGFLSNVGGAVGSGIGSKAGNNATFPEFNNVYKGVMEKYKYLYSLLASYDFAPIKKMSEFKQFSSPELGCLKTEDDVYYEGVWSDGKLYFGMIYYCNENIAYAGMFDKNGNIKDGVMYDDGSYNIGSFERNMLNCTNGATIYDNITISDISYEYFVRVGGFKNGERHGEVYQYMLEKDGSTHIFKGEYQNGEEVKKGLMGKLFGR